PNGLRCSAANAYIDLSGPGAYIGVVGLDNGDGARGGPHSFERAQVWAPPAEMATVAARQALKQTIAQKSNNCHPDASTPTYDALNQSLTMLTGATHNGQLSGSVILLTDGQPDPDTSAQVSAITSDLTPQFQRHSWPVDSIALGSDTGFRSVLSDLSNATSGTFYDDAHGIVPGTSPLNIAPFFVDIFARRNGRVVGPAIPPTQLSGGTTSRNFQLGDYADHLDVIAVKDQPNTSVTLIAPNRQAVTASVAGAFVANDPHYAIFSIDGPQAGTWQVNVAGSGSFLVDNLIVSSLHVAITAPAASQASLPLGQPFTIAAALTYQGATVSGGRFTVTGRITYAGGSISYSQQLDLTDTSSPGAYQAAVTIPASAPAGAYDITIGASQVSNTVIASADRSVRLELFPVPYLLMPGTTKTASGPVTATIVRWDPVLQVIYGLPVVSWIGGWPLGGHPAQLQADLSGQVSLAGQPYSSAAVMGTATRDGSNASVPITVVNDGSGRFHVLFAAPQDGDYTIRFQTTGSFKDSHGDFGVTTRAAHLGVVGATPLQEGIAWLITLLYLALIALIALLIRFSLLPAPGGQLQATTAANPTAMTRRIKTSRSLVLMLRQRNLLPSKNAFGRPGAALLFTRSGVVEARGQGAGADRWFDESGRPLSDHFHIVKGLTYSPGGRPQDDPRAETYTFQGGRAGGRSGGNGRTTARGGGWENTPARSSARLAARSSRSAGSSAGRGSSKGRGSSRSGGYDNVI
ncbi:MAG: hypothetical protein ABI068_05705, partial [Ktedonobacterales bacterium]